MGKPTAALLAVAVAALALLPAAGGKGDPVPAARDAALGYLAAQGGTGPYPAGLAPYAVEAAAAAGLDPAGWPSPSWPALDAVEVPAAGAPLLDLVRPMHAIAVAGGDLSGWGGEDLEARLRAGFDGSQFGDPALLNDDAFAILALRAGGAAADDADLSAASRFLASQRNGDGGWGFAAGGASGTDMTGMVLAALEAAGQADGHREAARSFVGSTRAERGFAERPGGAVNCDSTVWALRVLGTAADPDDWWFLLALQRPDGGFAYLPGQGSNGLCTAEAATLLGHVASGKAGAPPLADGGERLGSGPGPAAVAALTLSLLAATRLRRT